MSSKLPPDPFGDELVAVPAYLLHLLVIAAESSSDVVELDDTAAVRREIRDQAPKYVEHCRGDGFDIMEPSS